MLDTPPTTPQAILERLIEILESARARKPMYFQPMEPAVVGHWLYGVEIGLLAAGIDWRELPWDEVLARRGATGGVDSLEAKLSRVGFSGERLMDEMLAVAIETWRLTLERWPASQS